MKNKLADSMKKDVSKPLTLGNLDLKKTFIGDWKSFLIFALLMFLVWSYAQDTKSCREMIENIDVICMQRAEQVLKIEAGNNFFNDETIEIRGLDQPRSSNTIPPHS